MVATDESATRLAGSEREAMRRRFVTTSRSEWMFWEMGHWRESWPVDA